MSYTQADYRRLLEQLAAQGDAAYRAFTEKLSPGVTDSYGVRLPALQKIARDLARSPEWEGFLALAGTDSREERLLQGLVVAAAPCEIDKKLIYTRSFLPVMNSWEVVDTFCAAFKDAARYPEPVRAFIRPLAAPDNPVFTRRFALVMRMDYFINDAYIEETLDILVHASSQDYYVQMAAAWALSVCFVKYRSLTLPLLEKFLPDPVTCRRAIQKIIESRRVSPQDKLLLKELRRSCPS